MLYMLLWSAETASRPTWRNLTESFEAWAYRSGLHRQLAELERKEFLERKRGDLKSVVRLTSRGRLKALGGREPTERWYRPWDGRWRLVLFDVPEEERNLRWRLRKFLRKNHFGCLQKSAWVSPDSVEPFENELRGFARNAKVMTFFEGHACLGENSALIAEQAWDFARINAGYKAHSDILGDMPKDASSTTKAEVLLGWAERERRAWTDATLADPMLPRALWPKGYAGEKAWKNRVRILREAGRIIRSFH